MSKDNLNFKFIEFLPDNEKDFLNFLKKSMSFSNDTNEKEFLTNFLTKRSLAYFSLRKNLNSKLIVIQNFLKCEKKFIKNQFKLNNKKKIEFYKQGKNKGYKFKSIIHSSNDPKDCFIRIDSLFYLILLIFKINDKYFVLLKKIKILGNLKLKFQIVNN